MYKVYHIPYRSCTIVAVALLFHNSKPCTCTREEVQVISFLLLLLLQYIMLYSFVHAKQYIQYLFSSTRQINRKNPASFYNIWHRVILETPQAMGTSHHCVSWHTHVCFPLQALGKIRHKINNALFGLMGVKIQSQ